jgi:N-acetylmuramoyl-L-alanine amidase
MQPKNIFQTSLFQASLFQVLLRAFLFLVLVFSSGLSFAQNEVSSVRLWQAPDNTRIVFDLKAPVDHQIFSLKDPDRLVVDLQKIKVKTDVSKLGLKASKIKSIRGAVHNKHDYRMVFDLQAPLKPQSFVLPPNEQYGHRLVIDLKGKSKSVVKTEKDLAPKSKGRGRTVVVAIDAGHGGEDPGALGPNGLKEKVVVLQISKAIYKSLKKTRGIKPVLTRTGDYFLSLSERPKLAKKKHNADIFISIHADAFTDPRAHGSSVYALSRKGATSSAAAYLADKENKSDLIGGVRIDEMDSMVQDVVADIMMEGSLEHSIYMGDKMLGEMKDVGRLHKPRVEQAAFRVLKSADMISVLVETGFISNPKEARRLASSSYQQKLATAITEGLESYLMQYPDAVPGTYYANLKKKNRVHVIGRGDTLSAIATRYGVSLSSIKRENKMSSDRIKIGQKLKIPRS